MGCKIQNNSQLDIEDYVSSLVDFAKDRMGFEQYPDIVLADDERNSSNVLGKTAYYDPNKIVVHIYTNNRHPKDILRSIAHELVHHMQHEKGELKGEYYTGPGYAQKDPKMREMERQAYEMGNLCFRDWEDGIKAKNETIYKERSNDTMSLKEWKNAELNRLLMKKFGLLKEEHVHGPECGCPGQEAEEELEERKRSQDTIPGVGEKGQRPAGGGKHPEAKNQPELPWPHKRTSVKRNRVDVDDEEMEEGLGEDKPSTDIREALKIAMSIIESRLGK